MQDLMERVKKRKRQAWVELYETNCKEAKYAASALLLESAAADTVVVQAFQNTWKNLLDGNIQTEEEFRKQLLEHISVCCRKKAAKKGQKSLPVPPNKNFRVIQEQIQLIDSENPELDSILYSLPLAGRFIFVLHQIIGLSQKEIALVIGIPENTVRLALETQQQNIERIFAAVSQKSGDYSRNAADILEEAILNGKQEAVLSKTQEKEILESIEKITAPFEKKQKNKIILGTSAVILLAAILGAVLWYVGKDKSDKEQTNSLDTTEVLEEGTENQAVSYSAEIAIQDYGTIKVALDKEAAPQTVENFVSLAQGGFYDGLTFHRIIEGFMMQGGDPNGDGTGGSEQTITGEFTENGFENNLSHTRGAISMARSADYNSASSQFFIVHQDSTNLDGQYAVFGYVTEGMDIVDAICSSAEPTDDNGTIPAEQQPVITSIKIMEE